MGKATQKCWDRTKRYADLKKSLMDYLESKGMKQLPYTELVEQYMEMWCLLQMAMADLRERGIYVEYQNGSQSGISENKSVTTTIRISQQMNRILEILGLREIIKKAEQEPGGEDDAL